MSAWLHRRDALSGAAIIELLDWTGQGSSNTNVTLGWTTVRNEGGIFTLVASAADGDAVQVSAAGIYQVVLTFAATAAADMIVHGAAVLNNDLLNDTSMLAASRGLVAADSQSMVWVGRRSANDLIWVSGSPGVAQAASTRAPWSITRLSS